ncbi:Na(+)/H(+) antiporter subunit C [Brachybacterium sp. DNPG3]
MSVSLTLLLTAGILIACGVYLVLERTLTRVVLGFVLLGNGVNVLFIVAAGKPGIPPFEGTGDVADMTDPLPFAMVLTAIVISLGVTAFGMALAYRAWQMFGHDEVPDDVEDRRVLRRSRRRMGEDVEQVPWSQALSEENRRGALMRSQGVAAHDDPLGSDLSGAEDAPQDPTEADEGEAGLPSGTWWAEGHGGDAAGLAAAPGTGPATDADHDHHDAPGKED